MKSRPTTATSLGASLVGLAVLLGACSGGDEPLSGDEAAIAESLADDAAPLLVKDPRTLVALEERGYSLGAILGAPDSTGPALAARPAYRRIVDTVAYDLRRFRQQDPLIGVGVDFRHRQPAPSWLTHAQSRFELVAVVNRLDRLHTGGCGELRLIYRLAYTASRSESRLPFTFNVVFRQPDDGARCATVAQRWLDARSGTADALVTGPLASLPHFERIEIDYQSVRWPSNERREMGGHAEYVLRMFRAAGDTVEPMPLENTPRTNLSPEEREELRVWIGEHLAEIDRGTAVVPEKFLATQAISVGPRGLARTANRLFGQLFPDADADFGDLPYAGTEQVKSAAALVRRLDTMTCSGCHQARSVAGFHLLGEERDPGARLNALAIGRSPHFLEELPWRTALVEAVARGGSSWGPRPYAEHASTAGREGAHCGLGDPGFASWTCAAGLECLDVHGGPVGVCSPPSAPIGDVCETVKISSNPNPHRDRVYDHRELTCDPAGRDARCNPVAQGFPDGLCRADCRDEEVGTVDGGVICGLIPSAQGLTQCLAEHRPFADCLRSQNTATFLRTCDRDAHCRDDWACARVKDGPAGVGACMPPYFAFQARVDGHLFD